MSVAVVRTEKQAIILKPPEEVKEVLKKAKQYGLRVRLTYVPLDLGRTAVIAAGANARYIAELLGIAYDKVDLHPRSHPKTIADVMFYKDNKVVAKVQVHLCYDSMRIRECINTMKKKVRRDEFYVLVTAAEFRRTKDGPFERGMFLFLMTYEYLRQNTSEAIWEDMLKAVDMLRENLKYDELYITGFIDKYITLSLFGEFILEDIEKSIDRIEKRLDRLEGRVANIERNMATKKDLERFATKEDLERFATKEDLKEFEARIISKIEKMLDNLKAELSKRKAE